MIIQIDANNNTVEIIPPAGATLVMKCKHPYELKGILEEIFNAIDHSGLELTYVDEDTRVTIGEW